MKPYYEHGGITIFHGDCREVMVGLPKATPQNTTVGKEEIVCVTDPPYGINRSGQPKTFCINPKHNRKRYEDFGWDDSIPPREIFDLIREKSNNQIIWGGNYFAHLLPPSSGWLFWDKGQDLSMADGELAWTSYDKALRRLICNRVAIQKDGAVHPTQKPLAVILWAISYADKTTHAHTILDPFVGSGTTLRAAKDLGRKAIGIDIEEKYCEIAANRLAQEVMVFE